MELFCFVCYVKEIGGVDLHNQLEGVMKVTRCRPIQVVLAPALIWHHLVVSACFGLTIW